VGGDRAQAELVDAIWRLLHRDPAIVLDDGRLLGQLEDRRARAGAV